MRTLQLSTIVIISTAFISTLCFATETTVEYSERYQVQIAKNMERSFDSSRAFLPSSRQTQRDLICSSNGQVYLSTNLAGLTVNLADENGRMDFVLYFAWTDMEHTESVNNICDLNKEIEHFISREGLTRCTPNRLIDCNLD